MTSAEALAVLVLVRTVVTAMMEELPLQPSDLHLSPDLPLHKDLVIPQETTRSPDLPISPELLEPSDIIAAAPSKPKAVDHPTGPILIKVGKQCDFSI